MKNRKLLYHSIFWASIYLLWVLVFRSYSFSITKTMTVEFCYLIFITADFYAINNLIVPQFLHKKRYPIFVVATITIIALSAWLRALVAVQINQHFFHITPIDFGTLYLFSLINISIWVLVVTIVKMLIDRIQIQQQLELLEKERIKSELDYLKAQISPHALFNSLNTIYGHIDKNNKPARDVLLQFSELLKYQLYECGAEKVDLEKEIAYINNYVAFQRLRKDDKLVVNIETGDITPGLRIAPLLIIVLIENAFKFVSSFPDKENKISIRIFTKENVVNCCIFNTKERQHHIINVNSGGIGFANLKRRLELLYATKYTLSVNVEHDFYETNLTIDLA
ncbi:histidine kinase [Chitinophaga niastensis]|uniref:Histidine kinase n=1 Tax=Chitinophaga niastensis TaxID=536980 RepID=A0A2P8H9X4_CHINA|nr:histidine kinase [Chitinophaga niastensis]PSL43033.1 histidine kinase [Chitinophaga niastensis]